MKVRFAVTIYAVGKAHDARPSTWPVDIVSRASITHDHGALLEILNRRSHGTSMRVNDVGRV
jgi:hypothetical protein